MLRFVITCEHAANALPSRWQKKLGIPKKILDSHRGWDPGTMELAKKLAKATGVRSVEMGRATRLLIDLNRTETNPEVFSKWSRENTTAPEKAKLIAMHRKFRATTRKKITQILKSPKTHVLHLSIHSFTPVMRGKRRDTDIGILFDPSRPVEAAISRRLIAILHRTTFAGGFRNICISANKPYRGTADGHTTELRSKLHPSSYSGIEIEVNQRFVRNLTGRKLLRWQGLMAAITAAVQELVEQKLEQPAIKKQIKDRPRPVGGRITRRLPSRSSESRR
jgi:predicted N-formylglutamate amidohydrolase